MKINYNIHKIVCFKLTAGTYIGQTIEDLDLENYPITNLMTDSKIFKVRLGTRYDDNFGEFNFINNNRILTKTNNYYYLYLIERL